MTPVCPDKPPADDPFAVPRATIAMRARRGSGVLAIVAFVTTVAAGAVVFMTALSRSTTYDEGVYLASFDSLSHGQRLGDWVYTSQPPVFYAVGRAVLALAGRDIEHIRVGFALLALTAVTATFVAGRLLFGLEAGVIAAAFVVIAPPFPQNAALVTAGVPAVTFALVAIALFALASARRSRGWAASAGMALGAAIGVKLLVLPFVPLLVLLAITRRRGVALLLPTAVGTAAVLLVVATVYRHQLGPIAHAVIGDHVAVEATRAANLSRVVLHSVEWKTPFAWLVAAGLIVFALVPRARAAWPLWVGVLPFGAFLIALRPLLDHHFVLIATGLALAAGCSLGLGLQALRNPWRPLAVGALAALVAAGAFQQQHRLERDARAEPADVLWAALVVEAATPPGEPAATDMPIVAFRADRRVPGPLVDTSAVRLASGSLTPGDIERVVRSERPPVIVVRRQLANQRSLLNRMSDPYATIVRCGETTVMATTRLPRIPCPVHLVDR